MDGGISLVFDLPDPPKQGLENLLQLFLIQLSEEFSLSYE